MLRLCNVIGLAVGRLVGYLCSFDIDTSLGSAKVPFYVGMGALFGWLTGFVFHVRQPGGATVADPYAELAAAIERAKAAEAEVRKLRAEVADLKRGIGEPSTKPTDPPPNSRP
jgi:hypothetical protein